MNARPPSQGPPEAAATGAAWTDNELPREGRAAPEAVVLMPVKAFSRAKKRLAPVLSPEGRAALAREMAEHVIKAAKPLPVVVVCDDEEVADWSENLGARALREPGLGLNGAVNAAVSQLDGEGYRRLVVVHSDLPRASKLVGWPTLKASPWSPTAGKTAPTRSACQPAPASIFRMAQDPSYGTKTKPAAPVSDGLWSTTPNSPGMSTFPPTWWRLALSQFVAGLRLLGH